VNNIHKSYSNNALPCSYVELMTRACHHELVDCYEISISKMTLDLFPFYVDYFLSCINDNTLT
jgi:hypothetical protein